MTAITLRANGRNYTVDVDPETPLLYVLRNDLNLHAAKFGCGLGQCGACTVIVEGEAIRSCITPVGHAEGYAITTLEGLGSLAKVHPVQKAFIDNHATQCGYCVNGFIMQAKAFVDVNPNPTEAQIIEALQGNLCRCGAHLRVLAAVKQYARVLSRELSQEV